MKDSLLSHRAKKAFTRNSKLNCKLSDIKTLNITQTKEEKLFGNKSFLEIILGLIKRTEMDILGNIKAKKNNSNYSSMKQILILLKNDLSQIKKEKEKNVYLLQKIGKDKDKNIKDIIFNHQKSKESIIKNENINNFSKADSLTLENDDEESNKEISQLKYLNFKIENEIKKVDNLTKRMLFEKEYYKMSHVIDETRLETIYVKQRNNETINKLLHDKLIHRRKTFIKRASMKNNQDININFVIGKIIQCRNSLREPYRNYYDSNIISEEEKSYIETIMESLQNNINNNNNNNNNENDEEECSSNDKNNSLEFENIDVNNNRNNLDINKNIMNDFEKNNEKNMDRKDSSNNDDTCCNSSEKNQLEI